MPHLRSSAPMVGTRRTCRWRTSWTGRRDRGPLRRRGSGAGTRWPCPTARPASVLLEEPNGCAASTLSPTCYVCGPTSFVEHAAELLTASGHYPQRIRPERFGPTRDQHPH
jgi:ferredoxin-NADP reductase